MNSIFKNIIIGIINHLLGIKIIISRKIKKLYRKNTFRFLKKINTNNKVKSDFHGKRLLSWEPAPWPVHIDLIGFISAAMNLRDVTVEMVICDGLQNACIFRDVNHNIPISKWSNRCKNCYSACKDESESFNIPINCLGDLVDNNTQFRLKKISKTIRLNDIPNYKYKDINIGHYVISSVVRYYRGISEDFDENILREYLFSALITIEAAENKIQKFKPDIIYMSHGLYTSWGPVFEYAVKNEIPVIRIGGGFKKGYTYFRKISQFGSVHTGILSNTGWNDRKANKLSNIENEILDNFLINRYEKSNSESSDIKNTISVMDKEDILKIPKFDSKIPIWCIFSHVLWDDAVRMSTKSSFPDFNIWMEETLKEIGTITNVNWIVKIHPAEERGDSALTTLDIINNVFSEVPPNIWIIKSDDIINTESIFSVINGGITCRGTVGLELAARGKSVIVAADAYYAEKGFTIDCFTESEYRKILRECLNIPSKLNSIQKEAARRFAFSYFIQRHIPIPFIVDANGNFSSFDWSKISNLVAGEDRILDTICNSFINSNDFILDEMSLKQIYL